MDAFDREYEWQRAYLDEIRGLVARLIVGPAPLREDREEATDLMVLNAAHRRIACRMRKPGYLQRYPWDFTIRSETVSGARTEWNKLVEGWGDLLFYGHAAAGDQPRILEWFVVDLAAFRAHLIYQAGRITPAQHRNPDGTRFYAFDVRDFSASPPLLLQSSRPPPAAREY